MRKWSDPDVATLPSLDQAVTLDLEYARRLCFLPPLLRTYMNLIELQYASPDENKPFLVTLMILQTDISQLVEKIVREMFNQDKAATMQESDRQELNKQTGLMLRKAHELVTAVDCWQRKFDQATHRN